MAKKTNNENVKGIWGFAYDINTEKANTVFGGKPHRANLLMKKILCPWFERKQYSMWCTTQEMTKAEALSILQAGFRQSQELQACVDKADLLQNPEELTNLLGLGRDIDSVKDWSENINNPYSEARETTLREQHEKALYILALYPEATDIQIKNVTGVGKNVTKAIRNLSQTFVETLRVINYSCSRNEEKVYNYLDEHGLTAQSKKEMAEELGLSYPTILKYVHSYETIKEDLRQEVAEMLAPHTKPLKELIYDALDECNDKTPSEISDELHLDLTQTQSNYNKVMRIYREYYKDHGLSPIKSVRSLENRERIKNALEPLIGDAQYISELDLPHLAEQLHTTCGTVRFLSMKIMQERELEQVREESR